MFTVLESCIDQADSIKKTFGRVIIISGLSLNLGSLASSFLIININTFLSDYLNVYILYLFSLYTIKTFPAYVSHIRYVPPPRVGYSGLFGLKTGNLYTLSAF